MGKKMLAKIFPEQMKSNNVQILEAQWTLGKINRKECTSTYIIVKAQKTKEKEGYVNDPS